MTHPGMALSPGQAIALRHLADLHAAADRRRLVNAVRPGRSDASTGVGTLWTRFVPALADRVRPGAAEPCPTC